MGIEKVNQIFGVILKSVVIISIVILTFLYWQENESVRYEYHTVGNDPALFNPKTGEIILLSNGDSILNANPLTRKQKWERWEGK